MNNTEPKITSAKIIEEQENLKAKYEAESKEKDQQILSLQSTITKKNDEIFELQKENQGLAQSRDEWKTEAHRNRRIEQEKKQTKETNDFLTEFNKLQQAKIQGGSK